MSGLTRLLLPGLLMISVTAFSSPQVPAESVRKQPEAAKAQLADQNLEVGQKVDFIPGFRLKGWKYVDPWHMTVLGDEESPYLVTLQNKCYGLGSKRAFLVVKNSKHDQLARNDEFLIKNYGRNVARCRVKEVHQLDPVN